MVAIWRASSASSSVTITPSRCVRVATRPSMVALTASGWREQRFNHGLNLYSTHADCDIKLFSPLCTCFHGLYLVSSFSKAGVCFLNTVASSLALVNLFQLTSSCLSRPRHRSPSRVTSSLKLASKTSRLGYIKKTARFYPFSFHSVQTALRKLL